MKLTQEEKRHLHILGQNYLNSIEKLASSHFTFDAIVESMKEMTNVLRNIMRRMAPYAEKMGKVVDDMSHTSRFNYPKKLKLKYELHDLQKLLQSFSSEAFSKDVHKKFADLFKDAPISNMNVHEKHNTETTSTRNEFGFFRPVTVEENTLDCFVKFSNGKTLTWHTLNAGAELEAARAAYNENLRQLGHIVIPRMTV